MQGQFRAPGLLQAGDAPGEGQRCSGMGKGGDGAGMAAGLGGHQLI